jgi:Fe2+ or Zn2+ uptake regulation protein
MSYSMNMTVGSDAETDLIATLRTRGLRATPQRLVLLRVLTELDRHVTAEEILRTAGDRLPNLSLPTVYATLELFEELGLVRRVEAGAGATLFDPRAEEHQHLACRRCGAVVDLDAAVDPTPAIEAAAALGARAERAQLVVFGLCAACAAREDAP